MAIAVTIVIVTFNSADMLPGLLDSLPAALGDLTAEVIVVDNGSSDGTPEIARSSAGVRLVESVNDGYAAGINHGVAAADSQAPILVLNPDVRLDPGSVLAMHRQLERDHVGVVAPKIRDEAGRLHNSLRREPTLLRAVGLSRLPGARWSEYVQESELYERGHVVDWALGAVLLVSRDCYDAVGGWDQTFFLYSEETDFCLRARDLAFVTWYEPSASAVHIGGQSGRSPTTHAMQILNRVRLFARRHGPAKAWAYYVLTILSEASWVLRGSVEARHSVKTLIWPPARPLELGLASTLVPRP